MGGYGWDALVVNLVWSHKNKRIYLMNRSIDDSKSEAVLWFEAKGYVIM
jgi:hypothetical protein